MDQSEIDTLTADDRKALAALASVSPPKPELAFVTFAKAAGKDLATDYRHADLRGYVLRGQDLSAVNLEGADLRGADLHGAVGYRQKGAILDNLANSPAQIRNILEVIAKYVPSNPTEAPAEFVRDLAHRWKERGGRVAGKPRHSDRYLDDLLRAQGTPVRSLVPKLVGRTNLKPADAEMLVRLFLSHWDYVGDPDGGEIGQRSVDLYRSLLSDAEIERVCGYIAEQIMAVGAEVRGRVESATALVPPGQVTADLIATEFQKSMGLFTIGAGQTILVARPETALVGFRDLMNRLWAIDTVDDKDRILIWTLDLGRQDFEDIESRLRFMNVEALISRFRALKLFREAVTEARWNWLQSRTAIVLHDTRRLRPDVPGLPAFDPHHVLFSAIPPRWAGSPEFVALYGNERIQETNYTIFLRESAESEFLQNKLSSAISSPIHQDHELRYFGHALLESDKYEFQPRGLRLIAPGQSYVEALGTVFIAARRLLGLEHTAKDFSLDGMKIHGAYAMEKLYHHAFHVLRLNDFITYRWRLDLESS